MIGSVDPGQMRESAEGLYLKGRLDIEDSATPREAWRSMKNNSVALSFGYLATKTRNREDGVRELLDLDIFEVSITAAPMNTDTRILDMKSADHLSNSDQDLDAMSHDEHRAHSKALVADVDMRPIQPISVATFKC